MFALARNQPKSGNESNISGGLSKPLPVRVRRLSEVDLTTICQLYEDGSTVYEIAEKVGISRQRVSTVLKRAGIEMRRVSPTTSQIDEAVRLYEAGDSLAQIGSKLKFDDGTIWRHLKARGVTMRDTHGREA